MTRCLRTLLMLFLIPTLHAGTIEMAQWMPWEFIKTNLFPKNIHSRFQEATVELNLGELKPKLYGIDAEISGEVSQLFFNQEGMTGKQNLSGRISIQKLEINQVIEREINGNIIRVNIKAECSPFHIIVNQFETDVVLGYKFQEYWKPTLTDLSLHIPQDQWSVSPIECTGIGGLGNEVSAQLKDALENPQHIVGTIKGWLSTEVSERFDVAWTSLLNGTTSNVSLASMGKPTDKGVIFYAHLQIKSSKNVVLHSPNEGSLSQTKPQLILSQEGFETLLEDRMIGMIPQKYNLQQIKSFSNLMKSRLLQFFVWPDLKRFSSKTPFFLSTDNEQTKLSLDPLKGNLWTAYLNTNGNLNTVMGGANIDYIMFGLGLKTTLKIEVKDSKLLLSSSKSELKMSWGYGLLYQTLFDPPKRIATSILKEAINQFFKNRSVMEELPTIKLNEREWKLQNWQQNQNLITMDWL